MYWWCNLDFSFLLLTAMIMDNMLVESNKSICDWVLAYWRTLLDNKGEMDSSIAVTVKKSSFISAIMTPIYQYHYWVQRFWDDKRKSILPFMGLGLMDTEEGYETPILYSRYYCSA